MELVWYLDRAAGLLAYSALYVAVLSGIFYNASGFGWIHTASRRIHIQVSVFALVLTLLHGLLGLADAWLVVTGVSPMPTYGQSYFLVGLAVGVGALLTVIVAVLGFLDARRFQRSWSPTVVHAFAYVGFAFATVHAAAVGTDVAGFVRPGVIGAGAFLVYALLVRVLARDGLRGAERSSRETQ